MSEALLPTPYTNKNAPAVVQTETPERRSGEVTTWQEIDHAQVERPLDGAYLGRVVDSSGRSAGFRDKLETPVADKGFMFGVAQASYGYTGVYVQPLPGFKAEALHYDDETQQASWVAGQRSSDTVNVDSDWGKMSDITADLWAQETNYGNFN